MTFSGINFKKEIVVLTLIWAVCSFLIFNVFPASPYQGQSVIIFYASVISSAFYPAIFLFCVYLSLWSIIETLFSVLKGKKEAAVPSGENAE